VFKDARDCAESVSHSGGWDCRFRATTPCPSAQMALGVGPIGVERTGDAPNYSFSVGWGEGPGGASAPRMANGRLRRLMRGGGGANAWCPHSIVLIKVK
jgi:hypothetical protein